MNTKKKDFGEAMIRKHFEPDKADVIYDCAGNNITMGQAIKYARKGSTNPSLAVATVFRAQWHQVVNYIDGMRAVKIIETAHLKDICFFKDYLKDAGILTVAANV